MRVTKNVTFADFDKFIELVQKLKDDKTVINASWNGSFDEKRNGSVNVSWSTDEEL